MTSRWTLQVRRSGSPWKREFFCWTHENVFEKQKKSDAHRRAGRHPRERYCVHDFECCGRPKTIGVKDYRWVGGLTLWPNCLGVIRCNTIPRLVSSLPEAFWRIGISFQPPCPHSTPSKPSVHEFSILLINWQFHMLKWFASLSDTCWHSKHTVVLCWRWWLRSVDKLSVGDGVCEATDSQRAVSIFVE